MVSFDANFGSVLLDITGSTLTGHNIRVGGLITDTFQIQKTTVPPGTTAWTAGAQSSGGSWLDSTFDNRTFRTLLRGSAISASGATVQLQFRGRTSGSYIINNVSLVQRTGSTLNGDDSTSTPVTFGGSSNITVPPGGLTSDPIAFNLVAGQDVFLTFWVPAGAPGVYRTGGSGTTAWFITGTDESATIDWGSLAISGTRAFVYDAELLTVNSNPGGPVITTQPSNVSVTEPAGATFTVVASGDPVLTYQWRRNGANISGATGSSYTLNPTNAAADNGAQFDVVVNNPVGPAVTSAAATLTVQTSGGGGPTTAWTAGAQSSGGSWLDSTFDNRTFRTLLRGSAISASGGTVQLQFRGRTSGSYIINNVSLVQRTGSTLNGGR